MHSSKDWLKFTCFAALSCFPISCIIYNVACGTEKTATVPEFQAQGGIVDQVPSGSDISPIPANPPNVTPQPAAVLLPLTSTASPPNPLMSVKDFGAKGDGVQDDAGAFAAAIRKHRCILVPRGTYLFESNIELNSGTVCLVGEGVGVSILRSKAAPIPSSSTGRNVSWNMFRISNSKAVSFTRLTVDGGVGEGEVGYVHDGSFVDQQVPIEIYKSSHILFSDIEFTRFKPSIPTLIEGGAINPAVSLRYKTGALFIHESTNIRILNSKYTYPVWQEGNAILDSQDIYIDHFRSDCGHYQLTGNEISSVFQIFGATTYKVRIKNSQLRCFLGSAIVLNGAGNFKIVNNTISGVWENGVLAGEGLNIGEESGKEIYPYYSAVLEGLDIVGNRIRSTSKYAINFATIEKRGVVRYRDVRIDRNEISKAFVGIFGGSAEGVKIQNNVLKEVLRYRGEADFGSSIVVGNSKGLLIKQNTIDGTKSALSDSVGIAELSRHSGLVTVKTVSTHNFVNTQPVVISGLNGKSEDFNGVYTDIEVLSPTRIAFRQEGEDAECIAPCAGDISTHAESIIGIFTFDSDNVEVEWNVISGPRLYDYLHTTVSDGIDQNISFVSNTLTGTPKLAIQIGSKGHSVNSAAVYGNSLNGRSEVSDSIHSTHLQH